MTTSQIVVGFKQTSPDTPTGAVLVVTFNRYFYKLANTGTIFIIETVHPSI